VLEDGWYLMSTPTLESLLARFRNGGQPSEDDDIVALSPEEALAFRDAGNIPDDRGRSLRLVLNVATPEDLRSLEARRALFEPDHHDAPEWRRAGSRPVNVVPLRAPEVKGEPRPWWEEPRVAELEAEWTRSGNVAGLRIPADYRSFVYKTVIALRDAGRDVTVATITSSLERWLDPPAAAEVRRQLERLNP